MSNHIPHLDSKGLRKFGITTAIIIAVLFGVIFPYLFDQSISIIPWSISAVLILWALIIPKSLNPIYHIWMKIGLVLGWINTRIILGAVFYLIVTPIGLFVRLIGKNPLNKPMPMMDSYRITSKARSKKHMEKPY